MESGKNVYSAVPIVSVPDGDEILEWCDKLVACCERSGMKYMLGETSYYRRNAMFCRRKAKEGAFGDFVYAEGEYFHDLDASCSLREVFRNWTGSASGKEWLNLKKKYIEAGIKDGPMHYPTHSVSGPVCVMNAHAEKVTAYGYRNRNNDPYFKDAAFSNEAAIFQMSNGATVRICEFREVATDESETFRVFGTKGSYKEKTWKENLRTEPLTAKPLKVTELSDEEMCDKLPVEVAVCFKQAMKKKADSGQTAEFISGGHGGSHPHLVHEFVDAIANDRQPAINIWQAVRYMAMGVMAHKSALQDGKTLDVPDWGDGPEKIKSGPAN